MAILGPMLVSILVIGIFAQKVKGRTGALWGFLAFIVFMIAYFITHSASQSGDAFRHGWDAAMWAIGLMSAIITLVIMGLIVLTLPKKANQ